MRYFHEEFIYNTLVVAQELVCLGQIIFVVTKTNWLICFQEGGIVEIDEINISSKY